MNMAEVMAGFALGAALLSLYFHDPVAAAIYACIGAPVIGLAWAQERKQKAVLKDRLEKARAALKE